MALGNRRTDLHALNKFSSSIVKVSFKKTQHVSGSCSLGEVVHVDDIKTCELNCKLEERSWHKIFTMLFKPIDNGNNE